MARRIRIPHFTGLPEYWSPCNGYSFHVSSPSKDYLNDSVLIEFGLMLYAIEPRWYDWDTCDPCDGLHRGSLGWFLGVRGVRLKSGVSFLAVGTGRLGRAGTDLCHELWIFNPLLSDLSAERITCFGLFLHCVSCVGFKLQSGRIVRKQYF